MSVRVFCSLTLWLGVMSPVAAAEPPCHAPAKSAASTGASVEVADVGLVDQDGRKVRLRSDVLGDEVVVINFVFTTCTTVCPVLSGIFTRIQEGLGDRLGSEVKMVSVSVDPLRDTPARLKAYAKKQKAQEGWTWLTGEKAEVELALTGFGAYTRDFTRHPPMVLVGDPRSGSWTRLNGFPNPKDVLARVDALLAARKRQGGRFE